MSDWKKIVRHERFDFHEVDLLDRQHVLDGDKYNVKFPSGVVKTLPAIVRSVCLVRHTTPFVCVQEHVFFGDAHEGLPTVWVRGIDVLVQKV